jgi:hypothetical protein
VIDSDEHRDLSLTRDGRGQVRAPVPSAGVW